jgi:hypothetical protein
VTMQIQHKPITYEDLMTLYDDLTILPDSIVLRLIMTTDGKYILTRVNENGEIQHPRLDLTGPLNMEEMYKYLSKMWLQAFKEED